MNYGRLFLRDFIHLTHEVDYFRSVAPYLWVVSGVEMLDIDESPFLISLLSRVAKIGVLPQLLIISFQQWFDLRIRSNVFAHRSELVVFDRCNLGTKEP